MVILADTNVIWWTYVQGALTLMVAAIASIIAWRGWQTNQHKLRLDLYAKRYELYKTLRMLTEELSKCDDVSKALSISRDLTFVFIEADFLYGKSISAKIFECNQYATQYAECLINSDSDNDVLRRKIGVFIDASAAALFHELKPFLDFHNVGLVDSNHRHRFKSLIAWSNFFVRRQSHISSSCDKTIR